MQQSISNFPTIPTQSYTRVAFSVNPPVTSSGLSAIISVVSGPATITNSLITLTGTGLVQLAANQPGNVNYYPASQVTTSFTVLPAHQYIQGFTQLQNQPFGVNPITLSATDTSGLPLSYQVDLTPKLGHIKTEVRMVLVG